MRDNRQQGMICLTGDVHHMSMKGVGQRFLPEGMIEAQTATDYIAIAQRHGIKVNLFVTGKVFEEEWHEAKKWLHFDNVEIGGHTYRALTPEILHYGVFRYLFGSPWGPSFFQNRDIRKTLTIIEKKIRRKIIAWRNHSYHHDKNTPRLLSNHGIKLWSDEKGKKMSPYKLTPGIYSLPINIIPDHEHMIHAHIQEYKKSWTPDAFGNGCYTPKEWIKIVKTQVQEIVDYGGLVTILAHPICMYHAEKFAIFEELCCFLKSFETLRFGEILNYLKLT